MKIFLFAIMMIVLSACATAVDKRECRKRYVDSHLDDLDNVLDDSEESCNH